MTTRLLALAEKLNLSEDRLAAAIDLVPQFSNATDVWTALRPKSMLTDMAEVLPLPDGVRTVMRDPAQIIAGLNVQAALCSNGNLPPAVGAVINDFCNLAKTEPFKKLLNEVGGAVGRVETTVNTVRQKVDEVLASFPGGSNCKFFCGQP